MNKGKPYEERVERLLTAKGWKIVAKNFHSRYGEIDLIARKRNKLLVVEVKGSSKGLNPAERVDCPKVRRIYKTLLKFLSENPTFEGFKIHLLTASVKGETATFYPIVVDDCL